MKTIVILALLALAACASASGGAPLPQGSTIEPGFSLFCDTHPHQGTCQ
jgi:hypothetical protein